MTLTIQEIWVCLNLLIAFLVLIITPKFYVDCLRKCLSIKGSLIGVALAFVAICFSLLLSKYIPSGNGNPYTASVYLVISVIILLPLFVKCETEIFQRFLIEKLGKIGIPVSSVIFGAAHAIQNLNLLSGVVLTFVGAVFAVSYVKGGFKLTASIHYFYDLTLLVLLLVSYLF